MTQKFTPTFEQFAALKRFAERHGRPWKSQLNAAWLSGADACEEGGCYLRQVRNQGGPSWLARFKVSQL
jgi:hypothetical protein